MPKSRRPLAAAAACLLLCATTPVPAADAAPGPAATVSEAERQREIFGQYFEEWLALNPLLATSIGDPRYDDRYEVQISPEWRAKHEALERAYLERIKGIDRSKLTGQDRISHDVFRSAREIEIEGFRFPDQLIPLNQFYSVPNTFVQLGSGNGLQPFRTVADYDAFLKRVDGLVAWTDQAIANMREGVAKGYTLPRVLAERVLPQLESQVVAKPEDSSFWGPIRNLPAGFPAADRERLTAAYRAMIEQKIFPTYRRLHDYMRDEYLPKCRETVGLGALPDGAAWYDYRIRDITTTDYGAERIHELGLLEVARIHREIHGVMDQVGFKGDLPAFFEYMKTDPKFFYTDAAALIQGYVDIKNRVDPNLPRLFEIFPKSDYEIRAVEPFREKSAAGGSYQAASEDGSRPGIFYANTYDLKSRPKWAMEALSLHEGNPGHHFQISIQREQRDLPQFRRFGGYTAYSEGWGLYAESLGRPLGMYTDPYQYFGKLEGELWRAIRLVVDTGLHAKGWTRQQVLDYMQANSAAGEARRVSEAERYMAIPGQALAYKIGELKIMELRQRAERELGAKFDVKKFHTVVLANGALPLSVLESEVDRWIAAERGG
ncbi:MAG: DUF885 domain-containing protein [Steroidobacteraceae bacterium]